MRTNNYFFCLILPIFFVAASATAQTANFDETWKEFLANDKISNMSELVRPDKRYERAEYAQYLLMNTNTSFCQSEVEKAEGLMAEIQAMEAGLLNAIPQYVGKMEDLSAKIKAYHSIDAIWQQFLLNKEVRIADLEAATAAKTSCEKQTLAKYSFMTAYHHLCQGNVAKARDIFENRTLRLTEKTSLRVADVEGLATEVAQMKALFQGMTALESVWQTYVQTGVSRGFDQKLPLFACYPVPNMKVLVLNGVTDLCNLGPAALAEIKQLQTESGVVPDGELGKQIETLAAAVGQKNSGLADLNAAWEDFIPDNKVRLVGKYGYEYCESEPLIRAYVMDGFAYVCEVGEEMLEKIYALQEAESLQLENITMIKIKELDELIEQARFNGEKMENVWNEFVAQGDKLSRDYRSAEFYCDNIHLVEDWTIRGLTSDCEEGSVYLEKIDNFQNTFDFNFFEDLECRVRKLRAKIWDCRHSALQKLAELEAPEASDARLAELMAEYGMTERPEVCYLDK